MFDVAAVGLALIVELAGPVGMSDTSGLELLETIYAPARGRSDRVAFVVAAGGEL